MKLAPAYQRHKWFFALLGILVAALLLAALVGINYSAHWDEQKIINSTIDSMQTGLLLPRWYNYPSVSYDLSVLAITPEVIGQILQEDTGVPKRYQLAEFASTPGFKLRVRFLFYMVSTLGVLWTFLLILTRSSHPGEALLGAAFLGLSWEWTYHARWIAPDTILAQGIMLTMMLLTMSYQSSDRHKLFLRLGAIAAGFCAGVKYPGGLILVPLFLMIFLKRRNQGDLQTPYQRSEYLFATGLFALGFLVTTPGALLEPFNFLDDVRYEIFHYSHGHVDHNVQSPLQHAGLILEYLSIVAFSRYWPIALAVFCLALFGILQLFRSDPTYAFWFLSLPVLYLGFFTTQHVLFVRNLMALLPLLAALAARAGTVLWTRAANRRSLQALLAVAIVTTVAGNFSWLVRTSSLIKRRHAIDHGRNIALFLRDHPEDTYYLTTRASKLLRESQGPDLEFANTTEDFDRATSVLFTSDDVDHTESWPVNEIGIYTIVSSIFEVNLDYYPSWMGDTRVLAIRMEDAKASGLGEELHPK